MAVAPDRRPAAVTCSVTISNSLRLVRRFQTSWSRPSHGRVAAAIARRARTTGNGSSAPRRGRIDLGVDPLHGGERADDGAFLPTAPIRDLVAGHVKTALRRRQDLGRGAEGRIALVGPAEARELHVVPADREPL